MIEFYPIRYEISHVSDGKLTDGDCWYDRSNYMAPILAWTATDPQANSRPVRRADIVVVSKDVSYVEVGTSQYRGRRAYLAKSARELKLLD